MESQVEDLQGGFELGRLDYLDTIRKQDQQLKLLAQIIEKIQPSIRKVTHTAEKCYDFITVF